MTAKNQGFSMESKVTDQADLGEGELNLSASDAVLSFGGFVSLPVACQITGRNRATLTKLLKDGFLKGRYVRRRWYVELDSIKQLPIRRSQ